MCSSPGEESAEPEVPWPFCQDRPPPWTLWMGLFCSKYSWRRGNLFTNRRPGDSGLAFSFVKWAPEHKTQSPIPPSIGHFWKQYFVSSCEIELVYFSRNALHLQRYSGSSSLRFCSFESGYLRKLFCKPQISNGAFVVSWGSVQGGRLAAHVSSAGLEQCLLYPGSLQRG